MSNPFSVLGRGWRGFGDDHCTLLAAGIAYHVLFAFIPLITLLIAVFGFVVRDPGAQQSAADRVLQLLPMQAGTGDNNLILTTIRSVSAQSGTLTLIGVLGLIWSSAGIIGTVRDSLNIVWGVTTKRSFLAGALFDMGGVIGLGLLFALSLGGTIFLHGLQTSPLLAGTVAGGAGLKLVELLAYVAPALISWLAFTLIYRYVPHVEHGVGDVIVGALFAAVLFELCKHGFAWYVSHFNRYQVLYGALGGVMLFMLWTYLSALVMLFGAEIAAESEPLEGTAVLHKTPAISHS